MCSICSGVALSDMFTIMAMAFLCLLQNESRDSIAALVESLSFFNYRFKDRLRFFTSAADGNQ